MKLTKMVPNSIKPLLRSIYYAIVSSWIYKKLVHHPKDREELHQYWRQPWNGINLPQDYLKGEARSRFLVEIMKKYVEPVSMILEIGCNVGRNLNYLFQADFHKLSGIEISEKAVQLLKQSYPEMASQTQIYNVPIEEVIRDCKDSEFDTVFTMAVLEHIHKSSEWIFPEIVRITKIFLITIEDERGLSWRQFPRNYKKIFESLGMKQIEVINCGDIDGLELGRNFFARIFKKV